MPKEDDKKKEEEKRHKKRSVCILVRTNCDEFNCGMEISHRIRHLHNSGKYDIQIMIQRVYHVVDDDMNFVTHITLSGLGWDNVVKPFFECLSNASYTVHATLADEVYNPFKRQ